MILKSKDAPRNLKNQYPNEGILHFLSTINSFLRLIVLEKSKNDKERGKTTTEPKNLLTSSLLGHNTNLQGSEGCRYLKLADFPSILTILNLKKEIGRLKH